jgi:hypothetical protein
MLEHHRGLSMLVYLELVSQREVPLRQPRRRFSPSRRNELLCAYKYQLRKLVITLVKSQLERRVFHVNTMLFGLELNRRRCYLRRLPFLLLFIWGVEMPHMIASSDNIQHAAC